MCLMKKKKTVRKFNPLLLLLKAANISNIAPSYIFPQQPPCEVNWPEKEWLAQGPPASIYV